jgi:hypothetical protein
VGTPSPVPAERISAALHATKKPQPEGEADASMARAPPPASQRNNLLRGDGLDHYVLAQLSAILKHNAACNLGK